MKLYEHESKRIFEQGGIPIPKQYGVVHSVDEVDDLNLEFPVMAKAAVLTGGRGKAGGVKKLTSLEEAKEFTAKLLKLRIKEHPVEMVFFEEAVEEKGACYIGVTTDPKSFNIVLIASASGGVDIEEIARTQPDAIIRKEIPNNALILQYTIKEEVMSELSEQLHLSPEQREELSLIVDKIYRVFQNIPYYTTPLVWRLFFYMLYALKSEGFVTEWHALGGEGVEWLQQHPDTALLILDVGLPDGNGFEFCKTIRRFSDIPIIFLTARNDEVDRIVGLEIGADDYVGKPFSPRELAARVKVILKRTAGKSEPITETDFEIDTARARIRFHGSVLDLTRYEYLLLKMLLQQPERIYSRPQIMEQVWSGAEESLERVVDTHIKTLRAKLRAVREDADPIKTHRGMGYSISGSVRES